MQANSNIFLTKINCEDHMKMQYKYLVQAKFFPKRCPLSYISFFVARDSENSFIILLPEKPKGDLLKVQENFSITNSSFLKGKQNKTKPG